MNIISLIGLYNTCKNMVNSIYYGMDILFSFVYIVVTIIYIYYVSYIKGNLDKIKNEINSDDYVAKAMDKSNDYVGKDDKQSYEYHTMVASIKTSGTLNWMILKEIINVDWDSFKLFGFQVTDTYIIEKVFAILMGLLIAKNIIPNVI